MGLFAGVTALMTRRPTPAHRILSRFITAVV